MSMVLLTQDKNYDRRNRLFRVGLYFISFYKMHLENRLRCTEKTHTLRKRDVRCVYIKSIYKQKGREKEKEGEQRKKRAGEWKKREDIYVYISMIVFMTRIITPSKTITYTVVYRSLRGVN